jgi:hypothetical protein
VRAGAQRLQRMRLTRAGWGLQWLHQIRRVRDIGDGARLIIGKPGHVFGAHIQARTVIDRVDQLEDARFFSQHRFDGEQFVSFAVMRGARRADAHREHVDKPFDEIARLPRCVGRQQRADQLHEVKYAPGGFR